MSTHNLCFNTPLHYTPIFSAAKMTILGNVLIFAQNIAYGYTLANEYP